MADIKTKEKYKATKLVGTFSIRRRLLIKSRRKAVGRYENMPDEENDTSSTNYAVDKVIAETENTTYVAAAKGNHLRKTIKIKLRAGDVIEVKSNRAEPFEKKSEAALKHTKKKHAAYAAEKIRENKVNISKKALRQKKKNLDSAKHVSAAIVSLVSSSSVICLIIIMVFSVIGASLYMLAPETEENEDFIELMDEEFSDYLAEHGGLFGLPISGMTRVHISSPFGRRESPDGIGSVKHKGIDIAFPEGTPVLASELGTVSFSGENGDFGICIIIDHGYGIETVYAHMNVAYVLAGEKVARGEVIGEVGNTGVSTGPHLHFEVRVDGKQINPERGYLGIPKAS